MRPVLAALLRLLLLAGSTNLVNPYTNEDRVDLNAIWVEIPSAHVALEGDLLVRIHGVLVETTLRLRIAREDDEGRTLLATMPLNLDSESRMTIPCGYFSRGGIYYLELIADKESFLEDFENRTDNFSVSKREANANDKVSLDKRESENGDKIENIRKERKVDVSISVNKRDTNEIDDKATVMETGDSVVKSWKFDVLWPSANLDVTPEQIQTYPERQVTAIIEFSKVVCTPIESTADFWLELLYCGHSSGGAVLCDGKNTSSHAHVLYSEQMHGFPGRRTITLRCELFGQAGDYSLTLRPAAAAGPQDLASTFIKADWSDQFVLNVHGGSVFPCGEGVRVLFQYPECVLEGADRVRVFGRDGERLRYVAERRVRRGQHTATFDCRLFSERYPEYCFVYVSQAVTGAVADVRMDCLPTSPLSEGGSGGWGEWSPWSSCPSPAHCSTRTRSRHRFCDSPPPAYGAKYCEGNAVELAACECTAPPWAGDATSVVTEVGPGCRCGCVLHLAPVARLLAGSARACPARSFWLLQAEEGLAVRLRIEAVRLPCSGQSLKARDGDSLGSPLLAVWTGGEKTVVTGDSQATTDSTGVVTITGGRHILVELRSMDTSELCAGGFLAHATQYEPVRNASAIWASIDTSWWSQGSGGRLGVLALAGAAALAGVALALHSASRTRAYQRAADKESLTDSDACSASLELGNAASGSRSTLLSEVVGTGVSLRRLLPSRAKHTRLRESVASNNVQPRDEEEDQSDAEAETEQDKISVASKTSNRSTETITPEGKSCSSAPVGSNIETTPSSLRRSQTIAEVTVEKITSPPQTSIQSETTATEMSTSVSSVSEREDSCSEKDRDSVWEKEGRDSRASTSSAATLTNGWYSPALSGVASAQVRGNSKHSKESSNRRLLRSDLSLTSHPEMEIDYYDYEVNNAGSVPGSYLGMDPAFLVWIPPLEEGDILKECQENTTPIYEEILPVELLPDPGSNTESPEDRPSSSTLKRNKEKPDSFKAKKVIDKSNIIHPLNFSITDLQHSPNFPKRNKKKNHDVVIQMKDLTLSKSPVKVHRREINNDNNSTLKRINDNVKEKLNTDSLRRSDDDIKFADDSESSNEIKFADDDTPDSNKFVDKFDVKV